MSNVAPGLFYTKDDEWLRLEGDEAVIGISDYAQDALSDIVYLELPEVGASFGQGDVFGVVESVKAASDLFTPVAGEITAVNAELVSNPEQLNSTPYAAWLVRIKMSVPAQATALMDTAAYAAYRNLNQ
jgi:glycine cleavage system H protein